MITSVADGMGLEAFRKISAYYQHMNQASVHELRIKVMNPTPAIKEAEVAEKIDNWQADVMRLKRIGKATEALPDEYFLSALRRILCGRIKESVDLLCSSRKEPAMQDVLATVRKYSNLQRIDLTQRKRNDMHVDRVTEGSRKRHSSTNPATRAWSQPGQGPEQWA